jgi:hypothetical protein
LEPGVAASAASEAEQFSSFVTDVTIETEITKGNIAVPAAAAGTRTFHVEAVRRADGSWRTVLSLPPRSLPFPTGAAPQPSLDIARIEVDDGSAPRFYSRNGAELAPVNAAEFEDIRQRAAASTPDSSRPVAWRADPILRPVIRKLAFRFSGTE